jgi:hypothetical protein
VQSSASNGRGVGSACTDDSGCDAGNCVDRVCCESACAGCNACAAELTGKSNGICAPVLAGQDWAWFGTTDGAMAVTDSENCEGSRASRWATGGPAQCVNVSSSKTYHIGAKFKDGVSGNVVQVTYYPAAGCDGPFSTYDEFEIPAQSSWKALSWQITTPSTAKSASMGINSDTQSVDQVFFNPDGAQF